MKIASIVGARPQFVKLAPLDRALRRRQEHPAGLKVEHIIIHSGQHYDVSMNQVFFRELGIPRPTYYLDVRSGPHGRQTAEIMVLLEPLLFKEKPDWTLVYGDTNTTLAGALTAAKLGLRIAHIEAGLRSFDRAMPEETNRVLTDHCSQILFCPTKMAVHNLEQEGFQNVARRGSLLPQTRIRDLFPTTKPFPWVINVGDIMYDALLSSLAAAQSTSRILEELKLKPGDFDLATIHRAQNTDEPRRLRALFRILLEASHVRQVIFPLHPRTGNRLRKLSLTPPARGRLRLIDPVSYLDMLILEKNAARIWTDSGGIQKEAYFLKTPCLTLRDTTEWQETVISGWNTLVGSNPERIRENVSAARMRSLRRPRLEKGFRKPALFGDGHAARRIVSILEVTGKSRA